MASPSNRNREKWLKQANEQLPAGFDPAIALVSGKFRQGWTNKLTLASVGFGVIFIVALAFGYILIPGGLFVVWAAREMNQPRAITVSRTHISTFTQGAFNNKPGQLVGTIPIGPLPPSNSDATLVIGGETIQINKKEYQLLLNAAGQLSNIAQAASSAMPPPPPSQMWEQSPLPPAPLLAPPAPGLASAPHAPVSAPLPSHPAPF